ncbi:putative porin [Synechococcus sp. RS9907]|uniref:iron uptake porin n=1 Tax=Synechococcus sp. RS9907 TaxID=221350 RepID=UPI00165EA66C|nr:iron uptake porin [Synechococcus sp. RS9907]QNI83528.1 putative porin [Synechococcus sp. RS9907]
MKLFQQLLVAPAALGLLASGANAAELNINGVSDYAASADQVTSVTQFSDVYPTDWAYQALANLVETYGCVAGYPNGSFRGNRAMTRYEAAALLNACLDRVTEVTDELRRLLKEFETELAILKGRVDGLEARVGELEATQFSTTTKLKAKTVWVAGATRAKGDNYNTGGEKGARDAYNAEYGAFSFSYDLRLGLKTSFTGKDLLYTRLRAGNMDNAAWEGNGVALNKLDTAAASDSAVEVDRLYYRFPLGDSFTIQAGPLTRNTEMMGYKASAYAKGGSKILDFFGGSLGTPGVWNKEMGAGFGAIYTNKKQVEKGDAYFTVAANYVADDGEGNNSNPNTGGFMTDNSQGNITTQIAYGNKQWGFAGGYRYGQCGAKFRTATEFAKSDKFGTPCTVEVNGEDERTNADSHSWSFHGFWRPEESGWMPSISAGVGASYLNGNDDWDDNTTKRAMASWMVGLTWNDVFMEGNALGYAVGQPQFVFDVDNDSNDDFVADGGYAMELWYSFQVTDNIQITPAIYWLSRPFGDDTQNVNGDYKSLGVFGGLVQTTFKF